MSDIDELICRSLKGRTSGAEEEKLRAWRRGSGENEQYYRELVRLLEASESALLQMVPPPPPALVRLVPREERALLARLSDRRGGRGRALWQAGALLGLATVLAAVLLGVPEPPMERRGRFSLGSGEFVTGATETATVVLGDGTVVRLAQQSRLRLPEVSGAREVLLEGQAFFAVAPMPDHPFRVRTQAGEAVVLGTRFELRTRGGDMRLVVMEGRVALGTGGKRVEVRAGEMSVVSEGTTTAPVRVGDVKRLAPWLKRFLVFQSTPLSAVARELEREYGIRVEVADTALARQTITGWYADRNVEEVLSIVCGVLQADCSIHNGVARIGVAPNGGGLPLPRPREEPTSQEGR